MHYLTITLALAGVFSLVAATPMPNPVAAAEPDAVAEPWEFYGASLTGVPAKRDLDAAEVPALHKRTLIVQRDDIIPEELLQKRSDLSKRTQSPTSGPDENRCGPSYSHYVCGVGNFGLCCSQNSWCGNDAYYCGGGCKAGYGTCILPYLQLQYDADDGDSIWDVVSDNVFDAQVGDGVAYYGATPSVGWPS